MIETERLTLRPLAPADRAAFVAMCADPRVMDPMGGVMSAAECDAAIQRYRVSLSENGFTFWGVFPRAGGFAGIAGLKRGAEATPIEGEIEIGWRFARAFWGQGLATESARAVLGWAWANLPCARVAAITAHTNARSRAVMDRLGMAHDPTRDFTHPKVPALSPLQPHVTYFVARPEEIRGQKTYFSKHRGSSGKAGPR